MRTYMELYRRHLKTCPNRGKGSGFTRCDCPVWVYGWHNGRQVRRSMQTANWRQAEGELDRMTSRVNRVEVAAAVKEFLDDCRARGLKPQTMDSYTYTLGRLPPGPVDKLRAADLERWRAGLQIAPTSARTAMAVVRVFGAWLVRRGYWRENYAKAVKVPAGSHAPTLPFSRDEIGRLVSVASPELRALVLVMVRTGLRVSDALALRRGDIDGGMLTLRTRKTGAVIRLPVAADALAALAALPDHGPWYFGKPGETDARYQQARLQLIELGKLAGVADVRAHRFRDTLAVDLLLAGAELRTVSLILGHSNITTTARHYAPWTREQQRLIDDALKAAHARPPLDRDDK